MRGLKKEQRSDIADILKNIGVGLFVSNASPFFLLGMKVPLKIAFWLGCSILIALICFVIALHLRKEE